MTGVYVMTWLPALLEAFDVVCETDSCGDALKRRVPVIIAGNAADIVPGVSIAGKAGARLAAEIGAARRCLLCGLDVEAQWFEKRGENSDDALAPKRSVTSRHADGMSTSRQIDGLFVNGSSAIIFAVPARQDGLA